MSDPYGPRDDRAHDAARASNAGEQRAPDAWAEVYDRQQPPVPTEPQESLRGVAWVASVLISFAAVMESLNAWDFFTRSPPMLSEGQFRYGINIGLFYPVGAGPRQAVSAVVFLAAAALFITWQYKHAKNAARLGQRGGLGPGWAIGGWFVPLANLVLPVVQLVQSSRVSDPPPDRYRGESRTALIVWWAVVYFASNIEFTVVTPDVDTVETMNAVNGLLAMLAVPAAILAVVMIWQLTVRQERALDARGS